MAVSELRVLREADLKAVLDVATGLEIVERTFRDLGTSDIFRLSEPAALFGGSGIGKAARYKSKGATLISENVTGIRLISDVARDRGFRSHHMLVVFDDTTGAPIGLLNETWLHRFRTALTGVIAARYMAKPDSRVLALIGAGSIAAELFPAMTRSFDLDEVRVVAAAPRERRGFLPPPCRPFHPVRRHGHAPGGARRRRHRDYPDPRRDPGDKAGHAVAWRLSLLDGRDRGGGDFDVLEEIDRFVVDDFDYAAVLGDIEAWLRRRPDREETR